MKTPAINVAPRFSLRLAPSVVVAALIACCPLQTRANTTALSFTNSGAEGLFSDNTLGWNFSVSTPTLLTNLGFWDGPNVVAGNFVGNVDDGLLLSHLVTIWDSTGAFVTSATVPAGGGTLSNDFRYVPVAPLLLAAGTCTIGAYSPDVFSTVTGDPTAVQALTITTAPEVIYNGGRSGFGNAFPSGDLFADANSYFGPNFQFASTTNGVPDTSSTWMLMLLGVTATFWLKFLG
jgi:hypothetical protein